LRPEDEDEVLRPEGEDSVLRPEEGLNASKALGSACDDAQESIKVVEDTHKQKVGLMGVCDDDEVVFNKWMYIDILLSLE